MTEQTLIPGMAAADKKAAAQLRTDHDLHVLLVMKSKACTKAEALVIAYAEGRDGLSKRLK